MNIEELQALVTSIGEHCVSSLGRESLSGLNVNLDMGEMKTTVTVVLREDTDSEHKRAIRAFFDIEELFFDETVLSLRFVESMEAITATPKTSPAFSLV